MEVDRHGFEVLGRAECLDLLRSVPVGRLGLSMRALPVVLPVDFRLDGDRLVVRTCADGPLDAALEGAVVAFEADHLDPVSGAVWSVLVTGSSAVLREPIDGSEPTDQGAGPWAGAGADRWVLISTDLVSGRRSSGPTLARRAG